MTSPQKEVGADTGRARSVADVLDAAADLLSKPGAWTQGAEARNQYGSPCYAGPSSVTAVCFCLIGAVRRIGGSEGQDAVMPALSKVIRGKPWDWNDRKKRTQEEVVAKLREAATASRTQDTEGTGA